ncbi:MAG: hypothetical protein ABF991_00190 [Liquorilactobacillus hordei]|uniref:hypothetical protein n=1 Tax=Liquorilactobacillus hordei TaxID=468911 RepID=UPI0039EB6D2C
MNGVVIMASFAGSGKDTVADMLVKDYNSSFKQKADKLSLGQEIHNIASRFFVLIVVILQLGKLCKKSERV